MFGNHWSGASGDITYLICHVTSKNHVIKDHVMLWDGAPHTSCPLPSLVAIIIVVGEIH